MQLEQRDKELAAIGASIGCNCRPCVDHHIPKGREAGLSDAELGEAVATARAIRDQGIELLAPRIDQLLGYGGGPAEPEPVAEGSRTQALTALGASVGVNSHPLLRLQIAAASEFGLTATEVAAAIKMASYVQQRAGEITAGKATEALDQLAAAAEPATARS
jgi:AhpD family alkylhydroperoxidase